MVVGAWGRVGWRKGRASGGLARGRDVQVGSWLALEMMMSYGAVREATSKDIIGMHGELVSIGNDDGVVGEAAGRGIRVQRE